MSIESFEKGNSMKHKPRIETIIVRAMTPRSGERVTRKELKAYIRSAVQNHWAWGERMKWIVR